MSYPYRVVVSKAVETIVNAKDKVTTKITLTTILPEEAMKDLVLAALEKRGFREVEGEPGKLAREKDGLREVVDLAELTITTEATVADTIRKEKTVEVVGDAVRREDVESERDRLRARTSDELEKQLTVTDDEKAQKKKDLERAIAEKLAATEESRRTELNEALLEVYAEALKKKAAQLGSVTSVREERRDGGREYELTIKVSE